MGAGADARIHEGEAGATALSFLAFFCLLAGYYVIRPVREQLSAALGSTQLPVFYAATFLATLALTPVFAWLAVRYPRRTLVPLVYGFFIACLLGFVPLFANPALLPPRLLGTVFFVWVSVFNLFVVSVFWSFMADVWHREQARRLFPLVALGGTAGAVAGPLATGRLVGAIGVAPLLLVSAVLLAAAVACLATLGRWARARDGAAAAAHEAPVPGGMLDGLRQVLAQPFMRNVALLTVLGDCIGTINYALVTDYSGTHFHDAVARTRFAADVDLATNLLQVAVQLTLTRWLLVRRGPGTVIASWAAATVLALGLVALAPDPHALLLGPLPAVALALVVTRGLGYGMVTPARESLFTSVPREQRYLGKNAVDTAVWRLGDLATASTMNVLRQFAVAASGFAALGMAAAAASGAIGWRLGRQVEGPAEAGRAGAG